MKHRDKSKGSVAKPLLKEFAKIHTTNSTTASKTKIDKTAPKQPDLYQDAGGAYNSDLSFPQS
jgi:hypothetical protein